MEKTNYKIGVMGTAGKGKQLPEDLISKAREIGKIIAKNNCVLITGSCMGAPHEASLGANEEGGLIIGFSPARNLKEHVAAPIEYPSPVENCTLVFTGAGKEGRIVPMIRTCEGVIFISGDIGTLVEFSISYHMGKVIGILEGVRGISEKFQDIAKSLERNTGAVLVLDAEPKHLVEKVIKALEEKD